MAKIAWIEDDSQRIDALVALLKNDGHEITSYNSFYEVQNNQEAICKSDAIILDIILPSTNDDPYEGLRALETLRKNCSTLGPVIVCSRVRNTDVLNELKKLNVLTILTKPVRPSILHEVVTNALEATRKEA